MVRQKEYLEMRSLIVAIMSVFISPFILDMARAQPRQPTNAEIRMRFVEMDTNRDGIIQRREWRGSDQSFVVHDWNGDSVLSLEEVRVGARRSAREGKEPFEGFEREYTFSDWTPQGFEQLDHNRDGRIARNEWHFDRATFNRADHNRDGVLSRAEFLGEAGDVDDDRDDSFQNLDFNNDGRITRGEWHGTRAHFDALDTDRNGVLTRIEFAGTEEPPPDLFASLDINNDGSLTMDEWHWTRPEFEARDANRDGRITRDDIARTGGQGQGQADAHKAGYDRGLLHGRTAGRRDRVNRSGWFLEGRPELVRADADNAAKFRARVEYQAGYRDGFRRGYREGYSSPQSTTRDRN
jgi:Ca2+-binding EF-hand superfamily protein